MLIQSFVIRQGDEQRRQTAIEFLRMIKLNRDIRVEIKEYKKNRSTAQNRLLWAWYDVIAKDTGYEPEDLHEEMKVRVLGVERKVVRGIELIVPKSSTKLSVQEMTQFLHSVEALAAELGIALPYPRDLYDEAFGKKA